MDYSEISLAWERQAQERYERMNDDTLVDDDEEMDY